MGHKSECATVIGCLGLDEEKLAHDFYQILRISMKWKFLDMSGDTDSPGVMLRQDPWEDTRWLERMSVTLSGQ